MMVLHPVVKHDSKYWMLEKVEDNTAVLWRDGVRKEVNWTELEHVDQLPSHQTTPKHTPKGWDSV